MVIAGLHVILLLVAVTVHGRCLSNLDCVMKKREMCPPGSQECGPCIRNYEESKFGKCEFKVSRRLKILEPDSVIDVIQEYRMSKGHRINPTGSVSTTTMTTAAAASPHLTSAGDKPKLLHSSSDVRTPSLLASTFPPQMKDRKLGSRRKSEMNQTMSLRSGSVNVITSGPVNQSAEGKAVAERADLLGVMRSGVNLLVMPPWRSHGNRITSLIVICSLTAMSGILVVATCWYRLQKEVRLAQEMAYTAYKGSRQHPSRRSSDQMSHYMQHYSAQKKHFQAQESSEKKPRQQLSTDSEADTEEFAIYECPGLAPTGEMEVHNPLFDQSWTRQ